MIAVRSVQEVIAGAVTVKLPAHFAARRVEVIVLPMEEDEPGPARLEDLLLAAPTLTDEELKSFAEVSNGYLASFEREVAAFEALDPQIQEQYAGRAVAIYQGQIIADGDSKLAVLDAVLARLGQVPCYVDWVKPIGPKRVRVPSVWIAQ